MGLNLGLSEIKVFIILLIIEFGLLIMLVFVIVGCFINVFLILNGLIRCFVDLMMLLVWLMN